MNTSRKIVHGISKLEIIDWMGLFGFFGFFCISTFSLVESFDVSSKVLFAMTLLLLVYYVGAWLYETLKH